MFLGSRESSLVLGDRGSLVEVEELLEPTLMDL